MAVDIKVICCSAFFCWEATFLFFSLSNMYVPYYNKSKKYMVQTTCSSTLILFSNKRYLWLLSKIAVLRLLFLLPRDYLVSIYFFLSWHFNMWCCFRNIYWLQDPLEYSNIFINNYIDQPSSILSWVHVFKVSYSCLESNMLVSL